MANYTAAARSNYFQVKDIQAFQENLPGDIVVNVKDAETNIVSMFVASPDGEGWPAYIYDAEKDEYFDWDIVEAVAPHLTDDQWCVIQEIGSEKLRYLVGYSKAFNNKGDVYTVDINDIYEEIISEGTATPCEY